MSDSKHDTLFLHMGPGLNSYVERETLALDLPQVLFWDQPSVQEPADAFQVLANSVASQISEMYVKNGAPIHILAHSFGGHILSRLLEMIPEKIGNCSMKSTGYDLVAGFFRLLVKMGEDQATPLELKNKIKEFMIKKGNNKPESKEIWDYIQLIVQDEDFMRHYWPTAPAYKKYLALSQRGPALDFASFQNILNDFLNHSSSEVAPYGGQHKIKIELGGVDPLIDVQRETRLWSRRFPRAEVKILNGSGHFIHLENKFA